MSALHEHGFHYPVRVGQGGVERGRIFASGLGQIRPSAAFAAYSLCYRADHFAGLNFLREVFGYAHDQRYVAVCSRPSTTTPEPSLSRSWSTSVRIWARSRLSTRWASTFMP